MHRIIVTHKKKFFKSNIENPGTLYLQNVLQLCKMRKAIEMLRVAILKLLRGN